MTMPKAWTCLAQPIRHGSFLQAGLDTLSAIHGAPQPFDRYACPVCLAAGGPGYVRAATETEADRLSAEQGVN
jgi:hypothetical protein